MAEETLTPVVETPATTIPDASEQTPTSETEAVTAAPASATPEEALQSGQAQASPEEETGACPLPCGPWILPALIVVLGVLALLYNRLRKQRGQQETGKGGNAPAKGNGDVVEIYVGNLSYDMTEAQFRKEFERFGVVKSARIIGHRTSGKSKGYGFVEMPHRKEAMVAIKALHNRDVMGRKLRVNEARNGTVPRD